MIVIIDGPTGPLVWLDGDGRHDVRSGTDVLTPLTDAELTALILARIRDGIQDLIALQSQAAALIAASDTLRDGTTLAPATYSKAAMDAVIVAVRGLAARQSAILRVLSGEFADDLIGLARLAAQRVEG